MENFTEREARLLADLASRVESRVENIAGRCASILEPELRLSQLELADAFLPIAIDFLQGFLSRLIAEEPGAALDFAATFAEGTFRGHFEQPTFEKSPLVSTFASVRVLDLAIREEIDRSFADNDFQRTATHLAYARLWTRLSETLGSAFSRIREDYLVRRYEQAQEVSRLKSVLVADMAHEIRTPLNVILGYADLMTERLTELNDSASERFGDPVQRAGERLLAVISAILDLSRIEAGAYQLRPAVLNLAAIVERHVSDLTVLARNKHLEVSCIIEDRTATIRFDEHCLSGAITNLLQNAIKFTDTGTITVRLFRDSDGGLALSIRDTGRGIDPAYMPRLFEPFSREASDPSRPSEGSGLGLALVNRYLELNRARVDVESEKNVGTDFTISFAGLECDPTN